MPCRRHAENHRHGEMENRLDDRPGSNQLPVFGGFGLNVTHATMEYRDLSAVTSGFSLFEPAEADKVPLNPESDHLLGADWFNHRLAPEFLAGVDVGKMNP